MFSQSVVSFSLQWHACVGYALPGDQNREIKFEYHKNIRVLKKKLGVFQQSIHSEQIWSCAIFRKK